MPKLYPNPDFPTDKELILARVDALDTRAYAKTRNHIMGSVSYLSPYITRGVLTLPEIRERIITRNGHQGTEKFVQELAWREYWQRVWFTKRDAIFSDLRFSRDDWSHSDLVAAIVEADTGIRVIDQGIEQLHTTGYMHNHARMWTAMLACNVANAHWYDMSRWLYYHLLDGDLASNTLSWQWVAGTNAGKRYVAHQELLNACSGDTQTKTYLDIPREAVGEGPVPQALQVACPFTYSMEYPASHMFSVCDEVLLYTPWTLDPNWRAGHTKAMKVLLFDPQWFDRYPVSPRVRDFILNIATTHLPGIQVYVGSVEALQEMTGATAVYAKDHPSLSPDSVLILDEPEWLFPQVSGYYPSFFKYWQAVQKQP